jgi:uroporphyrinogen III methyltransferase/synthase
MAKIFISKYLTPDDNWALHLTNEGHIVTGVSCIETQTIFIEEIPAADWTFFSSAQGVKHFMEQHTVTSKFIGVMGEGTQKALQNHGLQADFIGQSSDPVLVGQALRQQLKPNQKILFPASEISKRSIASQLSDQEIIHLPTYRTIPLSVSINTQDIYIFTSPSNVDGFLISQDLPDAHCIAYGPTTGNYLGQKGVKNLSILDKVSSDLLLRTIKEKISG